MKEEDKIYLDLNGEQVIVNVVTIPDMTEILGDTSFMKLLMGVS
jgi:hypothetical protein